MRQVKYQTWAIVNIKIRKMTQLQMIDKTKSIAQNDKNISAVFMYGHLPKMKGTNIQILNSTSS